MGAVVKATKWHPVLINVNGQHVPARLTVLFTATDIVTNRAGCPLKDILGRLIS